MPDFNLDDVIRKVPDFPKKGILFYDVTSIFLNPKAFQWTIQSFINKYKSKKITKLLAVESRGFIFASPVALQMNLPLVLARKAGKLPGETIKQSYSLEYGESTLEIHKSDIYPGERVIIIDDLIATGGTLKACATLIEKLDAHVAGIFGVIGLPFLNYEKVLSGYEITTLINYSTE